MRRKMMVSFVGGMLVAATVAAQGSAPAPQLPPDLEKMMQQQEAAESSEAGEGGMEFKESPRSFEEMVDRWMTPMKVRAESIVRLSEQYAYPHVAVPLKMEIVKEEGGFVWLKGIAPERPDSALHELWQRHQLEEALVLHKREFDENVGSGFFLDYDAPLVPASERSSVVFKKAETGLPSSGRWQMGFDFADMNSDGVPDLVFGPPRLASPQHPSIYLGDGKGGFSHWSAAKWNAAVPFDYGDVAVADFDGDGFQDIALAIHFKAQYILYGSANGEFKRFDKLPSPEPRITSRAVTAADFDGDGRMDVAFLAELDLDLGVGARIEGVPTVWVVLNTDDGWKVNVERLPSHIIGDRILAADMDGDDRPDLALSSVKAGWRWLVPLNRLPHPWGFSAETNILGNAFHMDTVPSGEVLENGARPVYAAVRQSRDLPDGKKLRTVLVRYLPSRAWQSVTPEPLFVDDETQGFYFRIAVGDVNGDGIEDLVAARKDVDVVEVWTQTSDGKFFKERNAGVSTRGRVYDLQVLDVNGDGNGDIVVASAGVKPRGESDSIGKGGVEVWISTPAGA
jgi:hypothetical protein